MHQPQFATNPCSPRREGNLVVASNYSMLPQRCAICNSPSVTKEYRINYQPFRAHIRLCMDQRPPAACVAYFCDRHRPRIISQLLLMMAALSLSPVALLAALVMYPRWFFAEVVAGNLAMLAYTFWALVRLMRLRYGAGGLLNVTPGNSGEILLGGTGAAFLDSIAVREANSKIPD